MTIDKKDFNSFIEKKTAITCIKFEMVEDFMEELVDLFNKKVEGINNKIQKEYSKNLDSEKYFELLVDYDSYGFEYPNLMLNSLFVTSYSYFENYLNYLCDLLKQIYGFEVSYTEIVGNGIRRTRLYFKKVVGIDFPDDSVEWKNIINLNKLRNIIVHNDSIIDDDLKKRFYDYADDGIIIINNNKVELEYVFIYEAMSTFKNFLNILSKRIQQKDI